jgi:hypothetical protein
MKSSVTRVDATARARDVLTDLGHKASDLLQANCVIWVEGPSDRIYLNKWLSLVASDLVEGIHYAVVFYGGKVLAHFAAVDDPPNDLVEVLCINRHVVFVIDRDDARPDGRLNATKERIQSEMGLEQCWVTQGREIENYLRGELVGEYLTKKCGQPVKVAFSADEALQQAIDRSTDGIGCPKINYAGAKPAYAREICEHMTEDDLDALDLRDRLAQVVDLIRRWNHMRTGGAPESKAAAAGE